MVIIKKWDNSEISGGPALLVIGFTSQLSFLVQYSSIFFAFDAFSDAARVLRSIFTLRQTQQQRARQSHGRFLPLRIQNIGRSMIVVRLTCSKPQTRLTPMLIAIVTASAATAAMEGQLLLLRTRREGPVGGRATHGIGQWSLTFPACYYF